MARNLSGNYSLPSPLNPVITKTTITTNWANTTLQDVENELTQSLDRNGKGDMLAPVRPPAGTAAAPAHTFSSDPDTGLFDSAANVLGFSAGGTVRATLSATQLLAIDGALATPGYSFISDPNTGIYRAGADDLRFAANGIDIARATTKLSVSAATAATGGTRQDALSLTNGDLDLSGVAVPTATTAIANRLTPLNMMKAWTIAVITGAATFTITQAAGFNVATLVRASASTFTISFGAAFAGTYGIQVTCIADSAGPGAHVFIDPSSIARSVGSFTAGLSLNGTSVASIDGWGLGRQVSLMITCWGAQ